MGGADGIEERVRHHNDTLLDGHPSAEGQIARDRPIGHIDLVMFDWRSAVLWLVVVGRLVLVRDQVYTLADIGHEEVSTLDVHRGPREGHLADSGCDCVSVSLEYGLGRLNEGLAGLVKVRLSKLVERVGHGDLRRRGEAEVDGVAYDSSELDKFLGPDGPPSLPARGIEELSTGEDRHSSVPVVAHGSEVDMCVIIEREEVVHFIGKDEHMRAVIKDV